VAQSTCQPTNPYSQLNDGCLSSLYCQPPLVCTNGKCQVMTPGVCTSDTECGYNQYCMRTGFFGNGTCASVTSVGGNCSTTGRCVTGAFCRSATDFLCVAYWSQGVGADCTGAGTVQCNTGLYCDPTTVTCQKPPYHLLLGQGSVWGPSCIPSVYGPSCVCNFGTSSFQQLKESSIGYGSGATNVYASVCPQRLTDATSCATKNGCSSFNTGADTCFRNNCYQQYEALFRDCVAVGGVYPFCAAK